MAKTVPQALSDYQACLAAIDQLVADHATNVAKLATVRSKIEQWLLDNVKDIEVPEFVVESNPSLAWTIGAKNDASAIALHMYVDDVVLPQMEADYEESVKGLKALKLEIEQWGLAQLLERRSKNFKSVDGTGSLRTDVKYQVADKALFLAWAAKNHAENEITVTIRPNSKYFAGVLENSSELPPGLSQFREQRCTFIKSK